MQTFSNSDTKCIGGSSQCSPCCLISPLNKKSRRVSDDSSLPSRAMSWKCRMVTRKLYPTLGSDNKQNARNAIRSMTTQALPFVNMRMLKGKTTASFISHLVLILQFWWSITRWWMQMCCRESPAMAHFVQVAVTPHVVDREDWAQPPPVLPEFELASALSIVLRNRSQGSAISYNSRASKLRNSKLRFSHHSAFEPNVCCKKCLRVDGEGYIWLFPKRKSIFTSWTLIWSFLIPIPILQLETTIFVISKCWLGETTWWSKLIVKLDNLYCIIGSHAVSMT